jgi:hypothetical protein
MPTPIAAEIELTDDERAQLVAWSADGTSAQGPAQRARIVLAAAAGLKNTCLQADVPRSRPSRRRVMTEAG